MAAGRILLVEGAAPAAPDAGDFSIYAKVDNNAYWKDSGGTENLLSHRFADMQVPVGVINSINAVFTVANNPSPAASLLLFLNGVLQRPGGVDYTLVGLTITYVAAPATGDTHVCSYRY